MEKACLAPKKILEAQTNMEVEEGEIVVTPTEYVIVEEKLIRRRKRFLQSTSLMNQKLRRV